MQNEKKNIDRIFHELSSTPGGLNAEEVLRRQKQYGPNAIEEKKESLVVKALKYFWGPIAWMIESAAIILLAHPYTQIHFTPF